MIETSSPEDRHDKQALTTHPSFFQRRVVHPIVDLLRVGCSPRRMAWSLAAGIIIGINPLLGSSTIASLALAFLLRLNLVASQIATHLVYPLQLALFIVFIGAGDKLFRTGHLPLVGHALFHAARVHPLATTRLLWTWEWHALLVWATFSAAALPLLVGVFTPVLHRLHARLHAHPQSL